MSSDEIRLWRDSLGSFVRDSVFGAATHIAVPAAKHAALMRVVEAARALLDLLAYEHPDFGYSEIADLRAALALPADAAGSAEAVRAACAAVPALEEARRRRLRWADEAHAQILAVPAQPAPVAEAVVWDDLNMCDEETLRSCVDIIDRVPTDNGGISPTLGAVARTALYYLKRASATPRAEAYVEWCARHDDIEKVPGPFCPACAYASVMRDGVKMGRESAPRAQPAPAQAGEAVLPFAMFCYVCGEPAACIGYECGEEPGAHTLNGCCNDHCGHGNESERCVQLAPHPSRPGGAA